MVPIFVNGLAHHTQFKHFSARVCVKYLGTTLTNQNDIHDEIKSRL